MRLDDFLNMDKPPTDKDIKLSNEDIIKFFWKYKGLLKKIERNLKFWESTNKNLELAYKDLDIKEKKIKKVNKQLKNLDKLKNDFIANITHDFRSPLTVILNISDLALKGYIKNDDMENYEIIYEASYILKNSIDRLLDLAKMDARGIVLSISKVNIVILINKIIDFYSSSVLNSNIEIIKTINNDQIDNVYTDPEKLEQIINNLMSNAIKFIDKESGKIEVELLDNRKSVIIKISDNGIGIPKDKLKIIFNRFEQVNDGPNSHYRGTGIGLAFAKQLIDSMKGKIWAESNGIGKGSKFIIELKKGKKHFDIDFVNDSNSCNKKKKNSDVLKLVKFELNKKDQPDKVITFLNNCNIENEFSPLKAIILIVDNDKIIAELVLKYLKNNGYSNFILAFNGKQGLDSVYKYSPDIIICDFNMPKLRGDQFQDELINNPKFNKIPFIFLSAYIDDNIIIAGKQKGASAFLKKPINENELIVSVNQNILKYYDYLKILNYANIDELTGIYNRRNILDILRKELFIRKYIDLSIVLLDIDHFKDLNDTYGHQTGDKVLSLIGRLLKNNLREYDSTGRYGGEEFLLVLPHTNLKQAEIVAEGLRKKIMNIIIESQGKKINVTVSIGISSLIDNSDYISKKLNIKSIKNIYNVKNPEKSNWDQIESYKEQIIKILFKMADVSLYKAKNKSCNNCGYTSENSNIFKENICPECGSDKILFGSNKVVVFK